MFTSRRGVFVSLQQQRAGHQRPADTEDTTRLLHKVRHRVCVPHRTGARLGSVPVSPAAPLRLLAALLSVSSRAFRLVQPNTVIIGARADLAAA